MVPSSTKAVASWRSSRKRVMSPMETTPTIGQNSSSKKKNTLRVAIRRLRMANAQTATASARQLNENLLQLGLPHLDALHGSALGQELTQQIGQPLLGVVHGALDPSVTLRATQHARRGPKPGGPRLDAQGDHVAEADLALEVVGRSVGEDAAALDEGDLVAQLLGLAHVVRRQHDGHAPLAAQRRDVGAHPHRDVGIEAERGLVEEEQLGLVDERLGQRQTLLEAGRQLVVLRAPMTGQLERLDQLVDPPPQRGAVEAVEPAVERHDLADAQTPQERRPSTRHVEATAKGRGVADDVVAEDRHGSTIGSEQRGEDRQQRGLAGAVRPQHADDGAARDGKRDAARPLAERGLERGRPPLRLLAPRRPLRAGHGELRGRAMRGRRAHAPGHPARRRRRRRLLSRRMTGGRLEVEEANARFYRAFEALDLAEMEKVWAHGEHVKCVHPGWPLLAGWANVRASWAG